MHLLGKDVDRLQVPFLICQVSMDPQRHFKSTRYLLTNWNKFSVGPPQWLVDGALVL